MQRADFMSVADSSQSPEPLLIASAPNGAYKTRDQHNQLPITAAQLADTAAAVLHAGACMLHLHVRDANGKHTLAADAYQTAVQAIRAKVGDDLFIQLTSESAGVYAAEQQRQAIYALGCVRADGLSIALRELIRAPDDLPAAEKLFHHLATRNVAAQYILYSAADINHYASLLKHGVIPPDGHSVLLVVGRYDADKSTANALHHMVDLLRASTDQLINWMVCAFGAHEFSCLLETTKLGGHVRVGFENSIVLRCGSAAKDNAQLIMQLLKSGNPKQRPLADINHTRKILRSEALT